MKKLFFISIPSIIIIIIVFLVVQLFVLPRTAKGALQVTSVPQGKVYIDGKYIGTTPLCRCDPETMLPTGDHSLRIEPSDANFSEFAESIHITKSVLTVVDRKFGKGAASEGSIISLSPLKSTKEIGLLVTSIPEKAEIFLDNNPIGMTPVLLTDITESDHTLKIRKDGYNEKIVRIRTPMGYKLLANIYLSVSDLAITPTPIPSASPSASPSGTPTPSPLTSKSFKVLILQTPNGFLRVRDSASLSGEEIERVNSGQTFDGVSEEDGWYEIKLVDGRTGWVSGQFAQKK